MSSIAPLPEGTTFADLTQNGGWLPTVNGMMDLGERDDTLLLQYVAWQGQESLPPGLHAFSVNITRLADKAVREYRAASRHLTAFIETTDDLVERFKHLLRATDHIENCIDTVRRAEGFLRTPGFGATTGDQREMLASLHRGVRKMRDSIQHADERIAKEGRVPDGEPLYPALTNDGVYFAGSHLFFGELGAMVIAVWELAAISVEAVTPDS